MFFNTFEWHQYEPGPSLKIYFTLHHKCFQGYQVFFWYHTCLHLRSVSDILTGVCKVQVWVESISMLPSGWDISALPQTATRQSHNSGCLAGLHSGHMSTIWHLCIQGSCPRHPIPSESITGVGKFNIPWVMLHLYFHTFCTNCAVYLANFYSLPMSLISLSISWRVTHVLLCFIDCPWFVGLWMIFLFLIFQILWTSCTLFRTLLVVACAQKHLVRWIVCLKASVAISWI